MSTQVETREESATGIPIVDFQGYHSDDLAPRRATAAVLRSALESHGFCYLRNHGVPETVIDALFAQSRALFALLLEVKEALKPEVVASTLGYGGIGGQALDPKQPGDMKEVFQAVDEAAGGNVWPADLPGFRDAVLTFLGATSQACSQLMRAMGLSLGLNEEYFEPFYNPPNAFLRLLHYPPLQATPLPGQLRAGAHTDFGGVSLLFQNDEGGLEIQRPDGTWIAAPHLPGTAVVNTGDLIERWTNGLFISSPHRVVNPEGAAAARDRYSAVLFHSPHDDAIISCLEACQSPDRPPKYPPTTAGEHIMARARASRKHAY